MANKRPEIKMKARKTFMHNDGTLLREDAEYSLHSEREALEHVQKQLGERLSPDAPKGEDAAEQEAAAQPTVAEDEPWKLQIDPEAYLEKWPEGPNASQARAEIARRKSEAKN